VSSGTPVVPLDISVRLRLFLHQERYRAPGVAKRCGISVDHVKGVMQAQELPSVPFMLALEREYGLSATWLLTGEGERYRAAEPALLEQLGAAARLRRAAQVRKAQRGEDLTSWLVDTVNLLEAEDPGAVERLYDLLGRMIAERRLRARERLKG